MDIRSNSLSGLRALGVTLLTLLGAGPSFAVSSISGTSVAEQITDGSRAGMWMYTIEYDWVSDLPTWQLTLDLKLSNCPCVCVTSWEFDVPAGATPGNHGACTVAFNGKFSCDGDPWVGLDAPALDFWPMTSSCRPHGSGHGTLTFYTDLRPRLVSSSNTMYGRSGSTVWSGLITGQLPSCNGCGPTATEENTWGRIKATYR